MSQPRPELIFLCGPQAGERAVLMTDKATIGRSASCDVNLKEDCISRQQARFDLTADGWVVENLSGNGTWINGKRYKAGKKILLETGDVLGAGVETKMLFVAPGDDPDEALREYRLDQEGPSVAAAEPPPEEKAASSDADAGAQPTGASAQAIAPGAAGRAAKGAAVPPSSPPREATQSNVNTRKMAAGIAAAATANEPAAEIKDKEAARTRTAKLKKYTIIILGSWVVAGGVIAMIVLTSGGIDDSATRQAPTLTRDEIAAAMKAPVAPSLNPQQAQNELAEAKELFQHRGDKPGTLYKVVRDFKLYLAHKNGGNVPDTAQENDMYNQAMNELIQTVTSTYENAYAFERDKDWRPAKRLFNELLVIVPPNAQKDDPAIEKVVQNILKHLKYIGSNSKSK